MPQMNKSGKFIFGKSRIRDDLTVQLPTQAVIEYNAAAEGKVYLFTGSKITGGFCVTRQGLLEPSKLRHILTDNPTLQNYQTTEGEFIKYKGRSYCWVNISENGIEIEQIDSAVCCFQQISSMQIAVADTYRTIFDTLPKFCSEISINIYKRIILFSQYFNITFDKKSIISFY